jgi:spermidine synthase
VLREHLNEDGVFVTQSGSGSQLNTNVTFSVVFQTLKSVFSSARSPAECVVVLCALTAATLDSCDPVFRAHSVVW